MVGAYLEILEILIEDLLIGEKLICIQALVLESICRNDLIVQLFLDVDEGFHLPEEILVFRSAGIEDIRQLCIGIIGVKQIFFDARAEACAIALFLLCRGEDLLESGIIGSKLIDEKRRKETLDVVIAGLGIDGCLQKAGKIEIIDQCIIEGDLRVLEWLGCVVLRDKHEIIDEIGQFIDSILLVLEIRKRLERQGSGDSEIFWHHESFVRDQIVL